MKYTKIETKFLNGLLPDGWTEETFEADTHYKCVVHGEYLKDKEWDEVFGRIDSEFGEYLMEVYSHTSKGVDFDVFLRKNELTPEEYNEKIKNDLINEFERFKGQLVITGGGQKVMRLVGVEFDGEDLGYIYIYQHQLYFESVLCGFTPLKHYILDSHYRRLVRSSRMNDIDIMEKDNIYYRSEPSTVEEFRSNNEKKLKRDLIAPLFWGIKD